MVRADSEKSAVHINKLVESQEFDDCLSYLSLVNGLDAALLYNHDGLVMAKGEDSREELGLEAPYLLYHYQEMMAQLIEVGMPRLDHQVTYAGDRFVLIQNLERSGRFFLVVSGTKGSYDLFRIRCDRAANAIGRLLHDRGWLKD
jgi:predicted regulator of Ras-like GTPase activity (Roadblock/LC7/MglB family)